MRKRIHLLAILLFALNLSLSVFGQKSDAKLWIKTSKESLENLPKVRRNSEPKTALYYKLDLEQLKTILIGAPIREELTGPSNLIIEFPNAYGTFEKYRVMESSCMEKGLELKFPMIKTYAAQGIDDPTSFMRFSVTQFGLHTIAFSGNHSTNYIDPFTTDLSTCIVYDRNSLGAPAQKFECLTDENISLPSLNDNQRISTPNQTLETNDRKLRTFRLAQSCTGEYGAIFMGTGTVAQQKSNVQAQMTITINRVNGVYERDLAVHLNFVANNDLLIYLAANSDPWNNEWNTKTAQTIDNIIGVANYDIGHNFNTTGGGNAGCLSCVCLSTSQTNMHKGRGYTGNTNPTGDAFDIDYVAHEMGHQFGGYHTMNTCSRSGSGSSEVEPASGSTVMAYAGICPTNVQANSDDDFQYVNVRDISLNIQSGNSTCGVMTNLSNLPPTAYAGADYTIPKSTAYILEGVATDPDGIASLTYSWAENDPAQSPGNGAPASTYTVGPMYRNLPLKTSPNRWMPAIASVIAGNLTPTWEVTPSVARVLNFSFLVRDNSAMGGQTASDLMKVTVASSGPFVITSQSTATTWTGNSSQTITWNVASTTAAPVSCANVDVFLSIDGGYTYPIIVATGLPNNGTASITVPNINTTTARFMVRGAGNIFYDINNANITINAAGAVPPTANITAAATACQGATVSLTDASTGTPTSWAWSTNAGAGATFSNAALQNPTVNFSVAGTYTITLVATNANGSSTYNKVISINSKPVVTSSTNNTLCSGAIANFNLVADVSATFSWIAAANANVTGESTTTVNTATINNLLNNTTSSNQTVVYTVTPTAITGGCVGATATVSVTVVPLPTVTSTNTTTACSGVAAAFNLTASVASSFSWIATANANVTGESTTAQNGSILNNTLTLSGTTAQTVIYTITPTSTLGSCAGTAQTLSVTVNPLPTVTAASIPVSGTVCEGANVTLNGSGATSYVWTGGVTNGVAFITTAGTTTYTVTGTAANGCSNTATKVITVNAAPIVTASSTPASGIVCTGSNVTLNGGGATSYTWTGGVTNGTAFAAAAGTTSYTVTGTGANGCTNTTSISITGSTAPTMTSANTNTICSGSTLALNLTANQTASFSWIAADNVNVTGENTTTQTTNVIDNTLNSSSAIAENVVYTVTPTSGSCVGTAQTVTITINPLPIVSVSANPLSATVCSGNQITLTGNGATSYSWSDGIIDGITFTPSASSTYTVTGTDANGCSNTATQAVTVSPNITSLSTSSTSSTCGNANGSITVNSPVGGTPPYSYSINGGSFSNLNAATYTVSVLDANGCTFSSLTNVTNIAGPSTQVVMNNNSTCGNANGTINFGATTGGTFPYAYSVDGITFSTTTSYTVAAGTYSCSVQDANNCIYVTTVNVNNTPAVTPTISQTGNTLTASGATTYQWYLDGNLIASETNASITATQNGAYTVETADANGCIATSASVIINGIGIHEINDANINVTLMPNPNNGVFTISASNLNSENTSLVIKDVLGQVIMNEKINSSSIQKQIDLKEFSKGVYFISIVSNQKQYTVKILTQ